MLTSKINYTIHPCTQHVARNTERSQCMILEWIKHVNGKNKTIHHDLIQHKSVSQVARIGGKDLPAWRWSLPTCSQVKALCLSVWSKTERLPQMYWAWEAGVGAGLAVLFRARSQKFGGGGEGKGRWRWVTNHGTKREPEGQKAMCGHLLSIVLS